MRNCSNSYLNPLNVNGFDLAKMASFMFFGLPSF